MSDPFEPLSATRAKSAAQDELWRSLVPVPVDAPTPPRIHPTLGRVVSSYEYLDSEGRLLFLVARFEVKGDDGAARKETRPLTFCEHADGRREWRWKAPTPPRPVYGLDRLAMHPDVPVLVVEGEKTADAAQEHFSDYVVVTSPGGSNAAAHADWAPLAGRELRIWPDADQAGTRFASEVARVAQRAGAASVRIVRLPDGLPQAWDLADPLPDGLSQQRLRELLESAEPLEPSPVTAAEGRAVEAAYWAGPGGTYWEKPTRGGGTVPVRLANFSARIVAEETRDDGSGDPATFFRVAGHHADNSSLRELSVAASGFASLGWVSQWGARAVIAAGFGQRDHLRAAIQTLSPKPERRHVFTHTGWCTAARRSVYLHGGGAIGEEGAVADVHVGLPSMLAPFALPDPPAGNALAVAVRASLAMLDVAPLRVSLPVHAAIFRAVLGAAQFTVWLLGPTGVLKTALAVLAQQHFGVGFDVENLPASCSSTGNSLEALAFLAKDALLVVDDFAPGGTQQDIARVHRELERVVRAQGNRSGRGRLRADGELRPVKPPRGLLLVTGEDLLRGESARARLLAVEVARGDVNLAALRRAQADARSGSYASALSAFVRWAASQLPELRTALEQSATDFRGRCASEKMHLRTPGALGELLAAEGIFLRFAAEAGAISAEEATTRRAEAELALLEVGRAQAALVRAEDPAHRFVALLRGTLASGEAYVEHADREGEPPDGLAGAGLWGWSVSRPGTGSGDGSEGLRLTPRGRRIGWKRDDDLLLEPAAAYHAAQRFAAGQGSSLPVTDRTLWKRLDQSGFLKSRDSEHVAPKFRIHGARIRCLHLRASLVSETGATGATGAGDMSEVLSDATSRAGSSPPGASSLAGGRETGAGKWGQPTHPNASGPDSSPRYPEQSESNRGRRANEERTESHGVAVQRTVSPDGPEGPGLPHGSQVEVRQDRWRTWYEERAAVLKFEGGFSRGDAAARAFEETAAAYIVATPELDILPTRQAEPLAVAALAQLGLADPRAGSQCSRAEE